MQQVTEHNFTHWLLV